MSCAEIEQDVAGVTGQVRHLGNGVVRTVRSQYLVGAAGARSFVREAIGAICRGMRRR